MTEAIIQNQSLQVDTKNDVFTVNGVEVSADISTISPELKHVLINNHSYHLFIQKIDEENKTVTLSINGKKVEVKLVSRMEKLLKDLGMSGQMVKKLDVLKAPMPGLIHEISVNEGDTVAKGDPVLILEAMKMENVIKSPGDGIIKEIVAKVGSSVEKNAVLIRYQ